MTDPSGAGEAGPDQSVYVYAVGDATLAEAGALPELVGVDRSPVRSVAAAGLAAVVSSVDAARFGEEQLRRSLEDLHWLESTARAHHGVVDALGRHQLVAPVRLVTLYDDDDGVRALLRQRTAEFAAALDRIRGRAEWGVKAFVPPVTDPPRAALDAPTVGPGTSYLLRRRAARDAATQGLRRAADAAEELHEELHAAAVASRRYPPQDPRLTGRRDEMVLNAAYLVEEAAVPEFRRAVENRSVEALRLELTGPWAPYSFVTLEER